jgi:deoxyribodipyrimidine photolyase-related protein
MTRPTEAVKRLVIVLGDQLHLDALALQDFDASQDLVWMAEVDEESTRVPSSKQRIALFLSAMRHFAESLRARQWPLHYTRLDEPDNSHSLAGELHKAIARLRPAQLVLTAPGDWRVWQAIKAVAAQHGLPLQVHDDSTFFTTVRDFAAHAKGRKQLRMEYWYRALRQRFDILMADGQPMGGQWNFDADNRASFGKQGPPPIPPPSRFEPDAITREVIALVKQRFAAHPGQVDAFAWPVTRDQALQALNTFIEERLPDFGRYEDAMWHGEPWLFHAHLSAAMNLKLLSAQEVVQAAVQALDQGHAPLASVEGFVRQVLGWREFVRGIYWTHMPHYLDGNALQAQEPLPGFFWTGETDMACLRDTIEQTLHTGYAHHIQRLMVLGLYTLLLGVEPRQVHAWFLSVYVDAVEWVELPNTVGMSQYADGGLLASKPYVASGQYIQRMSNHCSHCRFKPSESVGPQACPYTTLYWDFLMRHASALASNPRMALQLKNLAKLSPAQAQAISDQATAHRAAQRAAGAWRPVQPC